MKSILPEDLFCIRTDRLRSAGPLRPTRRCLECGEQYEKIVRGLCPYCYDRLKYMIEEGCETWDNLVRCGRSLPSTRPDKPVEQRIREVICKLHEAGVYPTAIEIGRGMGRRSGGLRGEEHRIKNQIFKELGIEKRKSQHSYKFSR